MARFAPSSAAESRAASVARDASRIALAAMNLEWDLAGDAPPGALEPLYQSSRELLSLAIRLRSAPAPNRVENPAEVPGETALSWEFRPNPPLAPVAEIDPSRVRWDWPEWDFFGHMKGGFAPFWIATMKAADHDMATLAGLALFPFALRNFGIEARASSGEFTNNIAAAGGFSGQGPDHSILAAVGREFERFTSTPAVTKTEAEKPKRSRAKAKPVEPTAAPPEPVVIESDLEAVLAAESDADAEGIDESGEVAQAAAALAEEVRVPLDQVLAEESATVEPETPAEAAAQQATIEAFQGVAAADPAPAEPTPVSDDILADGWWVVRSDKGVDLYWIRAATRAEAWQKIHHDNAQRTINRSSDRMPYQVVPMPGDRWIEGHPFVKELIVRNWPPVAVEASPEPVVEATPEPLRFKLVKEVRGELVPQFWFEAPSEAKAIAWSKAACKSEGWTCLPIAPDQWAALPDHFRQWHNWPGRPLQWDDAPTKTVRPNSSKPEPAAPLFTPKPVSPAPAGLWRYAAFDHHDEPSGICEAPDAKIARRAFNRELPPTWQGKVKNCSDSQWAELLALGFKPIWRELAPDEPDLAAADEPDPPAVAAASVPVPKPAVELGIFDALVWNAGRLDRIGRGSAPTLADARADIEAELARLAIVIDSPKALIVRSTPDLVAAELDHAFALPRVELIEPSKARSLATAAGYPIAAPWWDVIALIHDEADNMAETILGRFQVPDTELALEFALRRFPMFDADQLVVVSWSEKHSASLPERSEAVAIPGLNAVVRAYLTSEVFEDGGEITSPEPAAEAAVRPSESPPEPAAETPAGPDKETLLKRALLARDGMAARWELLINEGASDDEVKAAIGRAFSLGVTIKGEDGGSFDEAIFVGGKSPRFWLGRDPERREAYRGAELITAARQLLQIPDEHGKLPEPKRRPGRRPKSESPAHATT